MLLPLRIQKLKGFQLQGGFAPPDPLTRGSVCLWTPLGAPPLTPVIGSRSRARLARGSRPPSRIGTVKSLLAWTVYGCDSYESERQCPGIRCASCSAVQPVYGRWSCAKLVENSSHHSDTEVQSQTSGGLQADFIKLRSFRSL